RGEDRRPRSRTPEPRAERPGRLPAPREPPGRGRRPVRDGGRPLSPPDRHASEVAAPGRRLAPSEQAPGPCSRDPRQPRRPPRPDLRFATAEEILGELKEMVRIG